MVDVRYLHDHHGLAERSSNHAKTQLMEDFLEFVDKNSQPNGRHSGSHSEQYFFLPKFSRINPPDPKEINDQLKAKSSLITEFNRAQEERG